MACETISYQAYFSHYTPSIIYDSIRIMQQLYIFFIGIFSYSIIRTLSDNISICWNFRLKDGDKNVPRFNQRKYRQDTHAVCPADDSRKFFSCMLRALGNSSAPLIFLAVSAVLNIALDILFVAVIPLGFGGEPHLQP